MNEAVEIIFDYLGWEPNIPNYMSKKPVGVQHRAADTTRAEELIGWEPQYTVKEGIERTLDWYVANRDVECVQANLEKLLHER
jgi:UDP-glucose 4-epimerase